MLLTINSIHTHTHTHTHIHLHTTHTYTSHTHTHLHSYYYAMVADPRGELVETSTQLLAILLDYTSPSDLVRQQQTGERNIHPFDLNT